MRPLGPTAAHKFPRKKPSKILPTPKIPFSRQIETLRAWATASGLDNSAVSNRTVAEIVGMNASTVSLLNRFFANVDFLRKKGAGYLPSSEVLQFSQSCDRYSNPSKCARSTVEENLVRARHIATFGL